MALSGRESRVCAWHPGTCESSRPADSCPESVPGKKNVALNQASTHVLLRHAGCPSEGRVPHGELSALG